MQSRKVPHVQSPKGVEMGTVESIKPELFLHSSVLDVAFPPHL